jgi:transcriptional regulator GlxA family with amidase domain
LSEEVVKHNGLAEGGLVMHQHSKVHEKTLNEVIRRDQRITVSLKMLRENLTVTSVAEVAATVNLSVSHLTHLFKAEIGITPAQYLRLAKLERAKELLQTTFLTIKEISVSLGIVDVSHFVRNYKKVYEETPTQTRIVLQKKLVSSDSRFRQ